MAIKIARPRGRDPQNDEPDLVYMYFCVSPVHSTSFISTLYRPQDVGSVMFEQIAETFDNIISGSSAASFYICGDCSIHRKEWLVDSNKTDEEGRYCRNLSVAYDTDH